MTTTETQYAVDHASLIRHEETRARYLGKKIAKLAIRFNPHGAGVFCAPSVADPIKATRDPVTFAIDDAKVYVIECYEHEIAAIMAWVEDDIEGCARAQKAYLRNRKKFMASRLDPGTYIPDEPSQWNDAHRAAASAFNESAAASFSKDAGEREGGVGRRFGIMPLLSCEVLETGLMPPKSGADMVNEQLAKISAGGNAEMGAAILALVDEMRQARGVAPAVDVGNAAAKKIAERDKKIAELEAKLAKSEKS